MPRTGRKQGQILKWFSRAIGVLLSLAIPLQVLAVSWDELKAADQKSSVTELQEMFGSGEIQCDPIGPTDISDGNAKQVGVRIGGIEFMLDHVRKIDRQQAGDSYDFIFTPTNGKERLHQPAFVYRSSGGDVQDAIHTRHANALIIGVDPSGNPLTNDGFDINDMEVAECGSFNDSALAKALDEQANDDGVDALNVTDNPNTGKTTNFLDADGEGNDPFMMVLSKLNEVLSSLNQSMVSALKSVMDMSDISEVDGLDQAWLVVRDLVNLLFALVLLGLAILSIVRIDPTKYNVRSVLPILIFAIIAVNFGMLMAEVLINSAFVLSQPFIDHAKKIVDVSVVNGPGGQGAAGFGTMVVLLLAQIIMVIGLAVLLLFFIIRVIVIWLLAALSPVLFLFMVLPLTRGEAKKLLTQWVKWVYMAPISFLILYIGALMLVPLLTSSGADGDGASGILRAIFYAGILAAAVMIPYGLGGSVMKLASRGGMAGGKLGGKGGFAALGVIPGVGENKRKLQAALEARKTAQKDRAHEGAIEMSEQLYSTLGEGGLAGYVTGLDRSRAQRYRDNLIEKEQKDHEIAGLGVDGAWRIVRSKTTEPGIRLSAEEEAIAGSRIGELAAWKTVVDNNLAEIPQLPRYASEGLHRGSDNPLLAGIKKNYTGGPLTAEHLDKDMIDFGFTYADAEGYKKKSGDVWKMVRPDSQLAREHPEAWQIYHDIATESIDAGSLGHTFNSADRARAVRKKAADQAKMFNYLPEGTRAAMIKANIGSRDDGGQHLDLGVKGEEHYVPREVFTDEAELAKLLRKYGIDGKPPDTT